MSDLISRKKVIDILEKEKSLRCSYDADITIFSIEKGIRELPTSYSVDKVVEELEETMQDLSVIEIFSHIDFDSTIQSGLDNFLKAYNSELLRIVKQGGVSDDVCEWRIVDRPNNLPIYNTSCGKIRLQCATGVDIYCNGCGKKIKVIGGGVYDD